MKETEVMKISIIGGADNGLDIRVDMDKRFYDLAAVAILDCLRANPDFFEAYNAELERRIKALES